MNAMIRTTTSRRAFLQSSSLLLAGAAWGGISCSQAWAAEQETSKQPSVRMGMLTDIHYADRPTAGNRYYRESLPKLREAIAKFNAEQCDLAFELGDLIDAGKDVETESGFLRTIEQEYAKFQGKRNYVLGNHCVYTLTKDQFLAETGMTAPHYSFDHKGIHFLVLDACFREDEVAYGARNAHWHDTTIPRAQVDWLIADLEGTTLPTVVFVHQRLDLDKDNPAEANYAIKNSAEVRQILSKSGQVSAVFMGHSHKNFYQQRDGIHYCVLRACIEGSGDDQNGYGFADIFDDGSIHLRGFHQQESYDWRMSS